MEVKFDVLVLGIRLGLSLYEACVLLLGHRQNQVFVSFSLSFYLIWKKFSIFSLKLSFHLLQKLITTILASLGWLEH